MSSEDRASHADFTKRIVDTCCNIANCWRRLPEQLDEAASKEGAAQAVFDALGKVRLNHVSLEHNSNVLPRHLSSTEP